MGRKSRRKRERRALQHGLSGIEEVGPFNWALMEALAKRISRHRRDNPHLFYVSFDSQPDGIEAGDAQDGRPTT